MKYLPQKIIYISFAWYITSHEKLEKIYTFISHKSWKTLLWAHFWPFLDQKPQNNFFPQKNYLIQFEAVILLSIHAKNEKNIVVEHHYLNFKRPYFGIFWTKTTKKWYLPKNDLQKF